MPNDQVKNTILFLNENALPKKFTQGTISGKELRLRASIKGIHSITAIAFKGVCLHQLGKKISPLESKVHIVRLSPWPYYIRAIPLFIAGLIFAIRHKPIVIEAESPIISGVAAVVIGKITQIPTLVEVRASYDELIKHKLPYIPLSIKQMILHITQRFVYHHATTIVANSHYYAAQIKKMGYQAHVINPGLQYLPSTKPKENEQIIIGYMGRLVKEKGIDIFIHSIHLLLRTINNEFTVEIAGEGPQKEQLMSLVKDLDLQQIVRFIGFSNNYQVLSRWYLMVNPNIVSHPLEMVNAESSAMGVPVICFGNQDFPETVIDHQTGIKLTTKNPNTLSQAIKLLIHDKKLRKNMSEQGIEFARDNFDFHDQMTKLSSLYHNMHIY